MTQRRPRRDAQLNRERIVDAPTDVIAEDGPNASLDKIASTAGVGAGTRYRHFPTRNDLLAAVFTGRIEALCDEAAALRENSEPPEALQRRLVAMLDHAMTDNGLLEALALTGSKPEIDCSAMISMQPRPCSTKRDTPVRFAPTSPPTTSYAWSSVSVWQTTPQAKRGTCRT